jgi:hypothetical protein
MISPVIFVKELGNVNIEAIQLSNEQDCNLPLLESNGKLKLLSAKDYHDYNRILLLTWCHLNARYGLPTRELIDFLKIFIADKTAIEIGAGHGDLGYHLNIPCTDSKLQSRPEIALFYKMLKQPVIQYPDDVEELEALEAINKYKPQVVIASWVTEYIAPDETPPPQGGSVHGVNEEQLLDMVDYYILIGNLSVHGDKKIMKRRHTAYKPSFICSRASNPDDDRIFVWTGNRLNV